MIQRFGKEAKIKAFPHNPELDKYWPENADEMNAESLISYFNKLKGLELIDCRIPIDTADEIVKLVNIPVKTIWNYNHY